MKCTHRILAILSVVLILGSGCGLIPELEEVPTLIPEEHLPTAIALTAEALILPSPTLQPAGQGGGGSGQGLPTEQIDPPSSTPAPTDRPAPSQTPTRLPPSPTPTYVLKNPAEISLPDSIPYGEIQILNPGPLSRVVSPIRLHAYLNPGEDDRVRVSLYGEDGRLLVRHVLSYSAPPAYKVHLKVDLDFEIPGVAETGRLEISTQDEYGRTDALAATDLILLSEGQSDVNPPLDLYEGIIIQHPIPSALIQDGTIIVQGFTRYAPSDQLYVELVNFRGGVVGSKVIGVSGEELENGYRFFVGEISYQVGTPSWVRVQVTARDGDMSGVQHLSSVRVLVSP
jgi:hypothetical protein